MMAMIIFAKDHKEFLQLQSQIAFLRRETRLIKASMLARKAGFRADQPRDEDGKWAPEDEDDSKDNGSGSSSGLVMSDESPDSIRPGAQYAQNQIQVVIHESALTGISTIDDTTKQLAKTLEGVLEVVNILPGQSPQQYGVAVHAAFAVAVKAQNLDGIGSSGVELSFYASGEVRYGLPDSIRTDVTLRNAVGDPIAIYDVKTGVRELTPARIRELREKSGASSNIPIIQIHVGKGVTKKGKIGRFQYPDTVFIYGYYLE